MNARVANDTPDKVRELQRTLYRAAKVSPSRRFHALYDKVSRADILERAWQPLQFAFPGGRGVLYAIGGSLFIVLGLTFVNALIRRRGLQRALDRGSHFARVHEQVVSESIDGVDRLLAAVAARWRLRGARAAATQSEQLRDRLERTCLLARRYRADIDQPPRDAAEFVAADRFQHQRFRRCLKSLAEVQKDSERERAEHEADVVGTPLDSLPIPPEQWLGDRVPDALVDLTTWVTGRCADIASQSLTIPTADMDQALGQLTRLARGLGKFIPVPADEGPEVSYTIAVIPPALQESLSAETKQLLDKQFSLRSHHKAYVVKLWTRLPWKRVDLSTTDSPAEG